MGCYDTLSGLCPTCGIEIEEQTKFIQDEDMRHFKPLEDVPDAPTHKFCIEEEDCSECKGPLFACFDKGVFLGFTSTHRGMLLYSDKSRREGIAVMVASLMKEKESEV
jgi:hypothetical protein